MAIDLLHQYYSQALITVANPLTDTFSQIRNSALENIHELKKSTQQSKTKRIEQLSLTLKNIKAMLGIMQSSHEPLIQTREILEKLYTSSPQDNAQHADLFIDSDDNSEEHEDGWEQIGSNEEIIS